MFLSGGKVQKKGKRTKKSGGFATYMHQNGVHYSCEKLDTPQYETSTASSGDSASSSQSTQPSSGGTPPVIQGSQSGGGLKEKKKLFKQFLNKMTKDSLMKKCRKYNIKVTTKKNGVIKPVKKETLVNKIVAAKFKK
jgi:hypothetical protein